MLTETDLILRLQLRIFTKIMRYGSFYLYAPDKQDRRGQEFIQSVVGSFDHE